MRSPIDPSTVAAGDPSGMLEAFLRLPEQLVVGYEAGRSAGLAPAEPRSLIICGMGGSAAGGDVVASAFADRLRPPVASVRGYSVPAWCGPEDLVLCLSFSGGTEETVACLEEARRRGSTVTAVASGGRLIELAGEGAVTIPAAAPMPRAGLSLLAGGALGALVAMGLLPDVDAEVKEAASSLAELSEELAPGRDRNEAMEVARAVGSQHVPVIWGSEGLAEPAAFRWKAAFHENAKIPALSSALPELDHHEIAGWSEGRGHGFLVIALRHPGEHGSVGPRLEATFEAIEESGIGWREAHARGRGPLAHSLSLILLGDVASVYHALARGVDPGPIEAIDRLKRRLAEGRR
ncbi:MAG TPA: SIS domain-containing protein [Actinomycetota bacterium]